MIFRHPGARAGAFVLGLAFAFTICPAGSPQDAAERPLTLDLGDGVTLDLVPIPAGTFVMGERDDRDAKPAHKVTISRPFFLGKTEVTQEQWRAVMGGAHAATTSKGAKLPVDTVEWWECQKFCETLAAKLAAKVGAKPGAKVAGKVFRLPSEAEWEYACRAGSTTRYCFGDDVARLTDYAWYRRDDDKNPNPLVKGIADTHPVGQKKPNAWGLHDMHGNVWEWCQTAWRDYPYVADDGREATPERKAGDKAVDVQNPRSLVDAHVIRGGSWHHGAKAATSYSRAASRPADHRYYYGFRVAMALRD